LWLNPFRDVSISPRPFRISSALLLLVLLVARPICARAQTHYQLDLADASSGWLTVTLEAGCPRAECDFEIPVWNATYQVRDFAQYVHQLQAQTPQGDPLRVQKAAPSRWRVEAEAGRRVRLRYRVLADRPGPFGAVAEAQRVILNLGQVLVYPVETRTDRCTVQFLNHSPSWKVAIELEPKSSGWIAPSYDRLIDTPAVIGDFAEAEFLHEGKRIRIVADGNSESFDLRLLEDTVRKIVAAGTRLMGDVPFPSYTFVYRFSDEDGGGMEYRDGTVMYVPANCRRCDLSSLTAHEFFHAWNVKRIRPHSMEPIDFAHPHVTPSLWFAEGVTSTYAQFIRLSAGLMGETEFLAHLTRLVNTYEARPAKLLQSAEESSIEAWLERYAAYGRADRSVSYYLKGELIGYLLDLVIRQRTDSRRSLDDVMRALNQRYAQRGLFFDDTATLEQLAEEVTGSDLSAEFDALVRSAAPIDWNRYLGYAGYDLTSTERSRVHVGLELSNAPGQGVVVARVAAGSPAERAGFRRGDHILTISGRRVTGGTIEVIEKLESKDGRKVPVTVDRGGGAVDLTVEPRQVSEPVLEIVEAPHATPEQLRLRQGWLQRKTQAGAPATVSQ
jgi:predicted metalloprotease with PDZ domain